MRGRAVLDVERIAQAAAAALPFELFVGDPAGMGSKRDRARLFDGDPRLAGQLLSGIGRGRTCNRQDDDRQAEQADACATSSLSSFLSAV